MGFGSVPTHGVAVTHVATRVEFPMTWEHVEAGVHYPQTGWLNGIMGLELIFFFLVVLKGI